MKEFVRENDQERGGPDLGTKGPTMKEVCRRGPWFGLKRGLL